MPLSAMRIMVVGGRGVKVKVIGYRLWVRESFRKVRG